MSARAGETVLGVISDTHDLLRPEAARALDGCDLLLHCGDVCSPELLERLAGIAPVHAVRGNNDRGAWASALPVSRRLEVAGRVIVMVHDVADLERGLDGVDMVVSGHSHRPRWEERDGTYWLNPGSAGPRRFRLPVSVARVRLTASETSAELVRLDV